MGTHSLYPEECTRSFASHQPFFSALRPEAGGHGKKEPKVVKKHREGVRVTPAGYEQRSPTPLYVVCIQHERTALSTSNTVRELSMHPEVYLPEDMFAGCSVPIQCFRCPRFGRLFLTLTLYDLRLSRSIQIDCCTLSLLAYAIGPPLSTCPPRMLTPP